MRNRTDERNASSLASCLPIRAAAHGEYVTDSAAETVIIRRALLLLLALATAAACFVVLRPFIPAITWAAILAYTSWPVYRRLRQAFKRFNTAAAGAMTLLLTLAVVVPMLSMLVLVGDELLVAYRSLSTNLTGSRYVLPPLIQGIPWVGEQLQGQIDRFSAEPAAIAREAGGWLQAWSNELTAFAGGIGRGGAGVLLTLLILFFCYRDGERVLDQCHGVVARLLGTRLDSYVATIATMTRSVVYGLLVTSFAQGLIAGIGYAIVGLSAAVLLGVLTGILSVVPVLGTSVVWGSLGAYLLISGHLWKGVLLLAWGFILVHPTDNILRPWLISNSTHVPFLLVMLGVLGGISAFGLVGAFVGPIVLAVGLAVWQEWSTNRTQ